jgi:hypothetical protein
MKAVVIWVLIVMQNPNGHPREAGLFASKPVCQQAGKIQQREMDKINRAEKYTKDPRGPVFVDGHSMTYECIHLSEWNPDYTAN